MTIKSTKMPRIDPKQLLKTLHVLLSPTGGIKSADEVNRLVQLMQKFSKKLVSKCIYIQILQASSEELLDKFLTEKGWGLLNLWFADAIRTNNWSECGCLIQLFAQCPMTAARLKENVEVNQAPKLIRQLSCDTRVDQGIRNLAVKVLNKWMSIVQSTPQSPPARITVAPLAGILAQDTIKAPASPTQNQNGHSAVSVPNQKNKLKSASTVRGKVGRAQVSREFINSDSDSDGGERRNSVTSHSSGEGGNKSDVTDDDTKPIKLLMGMSEELSQTLKKEEDSKRTKDKAKEKDSRKEQERSLEKEKERARREKERSRQKEREREERRKQERERERQKEKERREKRSKPYSQTELKDDLGSSERERIKMMAQKMKDEAKNDTKGKPTVSNNLTAGLGKIPKIPKKIEPVSKSDDLKKKEDAKKDKSGASFADLLGAMDTNTKVKKPVKVASSKNKNKELLESLSSTNLTKQPSKSKTESKPVMPNSSSNSKKESSASPPRSSPPRKEENGSSKKDYERRDSKDSTKSEKKEDKEKPFKIEIPKKVEKRPSEQMSPQIKEKKKILTESSMFGDILSTIMKDDIIMKDEPRKKKRRLSDVKAERAAKEAAELAKKEVDQDKKEDSAEKEVPIFSFYRDALEEDGKNSPDDKRDRSSSPKQENGTGSKNGSDNEMEFEEPKSALPREVIGILVYAKGIGKTKKSLKWEEESNLVQIEYFEMNEDERVNVNKIKFETAKQRELALEKAHLVSHKGGMTETEENPENRITWSLVLLDHEPPVEVYGKDSEEKGVQELRENSVLQALFFNNKIPSDPTEPDASNVPKGEPKLIPSEDTSDQAEAVTDFSAEGWPDVLDEKLQLQQSMAPTPMDHDHVNELLSSINPNLIQNVMEGGPPPATGNLAIDNALLAAQRAAAETLRMEGLLPPAMPGQGHFDINIPPPGMGGMQGLPPPPMDQAMFPGQGGFPPPQDFGGFPHMDNWRGGGGGGPGGPGGPRRGFGNEFGRGGGPRGGFIKRNDNNRHFGNNGNNRGFDRDRHRDRSNQRDDRRDDRRGDRGDRRPDDRRPPGQKRPCRFWMESGFCKEEGRCRFPHPPLN